jgi:putative colanic acid biosynthesis glycosyltransferase
MSAPAPLISVIIVCRNPGPPLQAALGSVWTQRGSDFEVVVVDGASTDGTPEWLKTQRDLLGVLISEPDAGIYDAMNKGITVARGEWVLFLGADDRLAANDVLALAAGILRQSTADLVAGQAKFDDGRTYPFVAEPDVVRRNFVHHQSAFYRRKVFAEHGRFDTTLGIQADYDFNLRLFRAGVSFAPVNLPVATCASGGRSDGGHWQNYREEITVRHRHFAAWRCWFWDLGSGLRYLRKKILRRSSAA